MCILLTRYPSISASITKASSDKSLAGTDGKVIGTFIQLSSVIVVFLFQSKSWFRTIFPVSKDISSIPTSGAGCGRFKWCYVAKISAGVLIKEPKVRITLFSLLYGIPSFNLLMQRPARKDVFRPLWDSKLQQSCR
ncbi:hypothetical protein Tco_0986957 [Tanacetum coccineum]